MAAARVDPVTAYARAVVAGKVVTGRLVRLACERHLCDLKEGPARGLKWDLKVANHALGFFGALRLPEGDRPFQLEPFQTFIVGCLFGWLDSDGFRRFRTAYVEAGKGNGKTPLAAGIGLYGLAADSEPSAEIYTAGVTRDQANYLLADASKLAAASPGLKKRIAIQTHNLVISETNSFMRPVSSEARTLDQKRVHMALIDEIHEHPSSHVVDKMRAGTKARRQALIFEITNSGYNRDSVCWYHHEYSVSILEGRSLDDSWFAFVAGLDPCDECRKAGFAQPKDGCPKCDDWRNEAVWLKANPGLGKIITAKYLREQVREAVGMPSKESIVKRLNFCIWTEQFVCAIPIEDWDACNGAVDLKSLVGKECYAAFDLSSRNDTTALVLLFPHADGSYDILVWIWVPESATKHRERTNRTRFDEWIRRGFMIQIPGNTIDNSFVRAKLNELDKLYRIQKVGYDPWNSVDLALALKDEDGFGVRIVKFVQGFPSYTAPTKELLRLVTEKKLRHGGQPALRWQAGNFTVQVSAEGNLKPTKEKATEKIDALCALTMALGLAMVDRMGSVYDTRGIITLGGESPAAAEVKPELATAGAKSEGIAWGSRVWGDDDDD